MTRPDPTRLAMLASLAALVGDARKGEAQRAAAVCSELRVRLQEIDAACAPGNDPVGLAAVAAHALWHQRARGRINTELARAHLDWAQAARSAAEAAARAAILQRLARPRRP